MAIRVRFNADIPRDGFGCKRCGFSVAVRNGEIIGDIVGEHLKGCPGFLVGGGRR